MCIVPVQIKSKDTSKIIHTTWIAASRIHSGHKCSYNPGHKCSWDIWKKNLLMIKTINGEFTSNSTALGGLEIASVSEDNNDWLSLPRTFIIPNLPVDNDNVTKPPQLRNWKYLENVMNQLTFSDDISVGLLIGANCTKALEPIEIIQITNGRLYAFVVRLYAYMDGVWLVQ